MKKIKISMLLNVIITILTLISIIIMFTGFKFMYGVEPILETTKFGLFKFFTIDSNLLMGISAFLFFTQERKLINHKINSIPLKYFVLKFISTVAVSITFLVVFLYLGPISKDGIVSLLQNSNLFFHLIIPVISIITFVFLEENSNFKFKYIIYSVIPTFLYGIFYLINVLIHVENGKISPVYDWYYFVQGGLWQIFIVAPLMILLTYVIGIILYKLNRTFSI